MLFSWAKGISWINSRCKCYKWQLQLSRWFLSCSFMGLVFAGAIWKAAFWQAVPYWEQKNSADISLIGILVFLWPPGTCRVRRYVHKVSTSLVAVTPSLLQGWCDAFVLFILWSLSTWAHCFYQITRLWEFKPDCTGWLRSYTWTQATPGVFRT